MEFVEVFRVLTIVMGVISSAAAVIWGYAKLNSRVEHNEKRVEKVDTQVGVALTKINERIDSERERVDKREDLLRDKMDSVETKLSALHIEVISSLKEK